MPPECQVPRYRNLIHDLDVRLKMLASRGDAKNAEASELTELWVDTNLKEFPALAALGVGGLAVVWAPYQAVTKAGLPRRVKFATALSLKKYGTFVGTTVVAPVYRYFRETPDWLEARAEGAWDQSADSYQTIEGLLSRRELAKRDCRSVMAGKVTGTSPRVAEKRIKGDTVKVFHQSWSFHLGGKTQGQASSEARE